MERMAGIHVFLSWVWVKEILQSIYLLKNREFSQGWLLQWIQVIGLLLLSFFCYIKVSKLLVFFERSKLNLTQVMVNLSHYRKTRNQAHALCFAIVTLFNLLKSTVYHINSYSFYCIILKALFTVELKFRFENKKVFK